jgi:hypothetical protein
MGVCQVFSQLEARMGPLLQALLDLQTIEREIVDIQQQLARRERAVSRQRKVLEDLRAALAAERSSLQRAQMDADQVDLDLKARSGHVERMRERLNSVRTNKEYAAVLAELNSEKADVSKIETRALEMLEVVEAQKAAFAERQHAEQAEVARLGDLQAQYEQAQRSFSGKLKELQGQRAAAASHVDGGALGQFERLSERYDGEALAQIERVHVRRDDFLCGGCNMSLSAEVANAVLSRDEITTCKNCGRILWMMRGT